LGACRNASHRRREARGNGCQKEFLRRPTPFKSAKLVGGSEMDRIWSGIRFDDSCTSRSPPSLHPIVMLCTFFRHGIAPTHRVEKYLFLQLFPHYTQARKKAHRGSSRRFRSVGARLEAPPPTITSISCRTLFAAVHAITLGCDPAHICLDEIKMHRSPLPHTPPHTNPILDVSVSFALSHE